MYEIVTGKPIVQKYGGTSVGSVDRIKSIAKRIKKQIAAGHDRIAVVVSAMSGETNRLVGLIEEINGKASRRNYDMAVAAGEQVSVALMAAALEGEGLSAEGFLAHQIGIYTDGFHSQARIQSIDCGVLHDAWGRKVVPIIAGFQGVSADGNITTLGRGGSDTSAVALAVALEAGFCEINTDVDGVFTADPRIVPNARLNLDMDFELALEMASLGSKVLHARCVELAAKYQMPVVVRNTFKEDSHSRTKIMSFTDSQRLEAPVVSGVTVAKNVVRIAIEGLPETSASVASVFESIAKSGVNVDIIVHNKSEERQTIRLGFTIGSGELDKTLNIIEDWRREEGLSSIKVEHEDNLAKVSVVGLGMQSHPGVASRCFALLAEKNIPITMISTSEIKISCVIPMDLSDSACQCLHEGFLEG
ncbi:MAG: aspartate kinase [Pseudobacteriovorax sp.]|nr:aspartate kinase [Pseudobacteriovorax sp.]